MSERRTIYRDAAAGTGGLGPNQSQLYVDGDKLIGQQYGGTAVELADLSGGSLIPVGVIWSYAGSAAPTGWLLCNGDEKLTATYPDLSALIINTYGTPASGYFKLPDLQGRMPLGKSGGYAIGSTGGEATVTLTDAQIPAHSHPNTATAETTLSASVDHWGAFASTMSYIYITGTPSSYPVETSSLGDANYSASTDVTMTNEDNTGGGGSHENLPPYLAVNYIIKHD